MAVIGAILATAMTWVGLPAKGLTQSEVDVACADSSEAYETYRAARSDFEEQALVLEAANADLDQAQLQVQRIRSSFDSRQEEQTRLRGQAEDQAVRLYMESATGPGVATALFSTSEELLVATEFLTSSTETSLQIVHDLRAATSELERLGVRLDQALSDLRTNRDEQRLKTGRQETAMLSAGEAYDQLSDRCKELQAEYEAQEARRRAEEEERRKREAEAARRGATSGSGGRDSDAAVNSKPIGDVICPFTPGRTQFIDSWGFPRSGGRTHKGTDMFAPLDEPVYAVTSGVVSTRTGGIGGKTIWLSSDSGVGFYYAHLNGYAVESGQRVEQGQLIAYNGNTGNARGTSPHVHLQIHPSGRGGAPVNPYNTMAAVCF